MMPLRKFAIRNRNGRRSLQMLAESLRNGSTGAPELLLAMKLISALEHLVDVKPSPIRQDRVKNGSLYIGATATHRAIETRPGATEYTGARRNGD
jgi:CO/xanthine dehydrogenase FAD-binding subunit